MNLSCQRIIGTYLKISLCNLIENFVLDHCRYLARHCVFSNFTEITGNILYYVGFTIFDNSVSYFSNILSSSDPRFEILLRYANG